jgi:hypothetical protein
MPGDRVTLQLINNQEPNMKSKIKFAKGMRPFAEERKRKDQAKTRAKSGAAKTKPATAPRKSASRSQAGRTNAADEFETFIAKLLGDFCQELPRLAVPGSKLRALNIDPDRATAFARGFVTRHRAALLRKFGASN